MRHQNLGIFAATVAAPYVVVFLIDFPGYIMFLGGSATRDPLGLPIKSSVPGTFGLIYFGLPLLLLSSISAFLLHLLKFRSQQHAIGSGAALGFCFMAVLFRESSAFLFFSVTGALSGAICGWIAVKTHSDSEYCLIALRAA